MLKSLSITNNHVLNNAIYAKYLGIHIDNNLSWNTHVEHVLKVCCQRIGMFKKVLAFLPNYVLSMYYNAFILPCFSYCITFWFNNDRSGRYKLINKIDSVLVLLAKRCGVNVLDFVVNSGLCNVNNTYKLQCLSLMHDICNNRIQLPYFPVITNNSVHTHNTRVASNIHINLISPLDRRNFIYHSKLLWNNVPIEHRLLTKKEFLRLCKVNFLSISA